MTRTERTRAPVGSGFAVPHSFCSPRPSPPRRNSFAATPAATTSMFTSSPGSIASMLASRNSLSALGAEPKLRRRRAALRLLSAAHLDAGRRAGSRFPWWLVPIAFTFLCLALPDLPRAPGALEALDDVPATLAGCAALFSGFTLFTAYERSAFPEFTGGVWLPLLLAVRSCATATRPRSSPPRIRRLNCSARR